MWEILHSADKKTACANAYVHKVPQKISETLLGVWQHRTGEYEEQTGSEKYKSNSTLVRILGFALGTTGSHQQSKHDSSHDTYVQEYDFCP